MGILSKLSKKSSTEEKEVKKSAPKKSTTVKKEVEVKKADNKDTKNAYKVLVRPLVTEKSTELSNSSQYVFEVAKDANKISISQAIESVYNVKPIKVNVVNVRGKVVTFGRNTGKRKNFKKAIVILPKGKSIAVFEGV